MYDAIIVGGGVTGAACATYLARGGLRVLLCDRTPLPSPAVSTHFFGPSVLAALAELGLLDQVLATGAPPLRRWHLEVEDGYYGGPMLPRSAHPYNLCVRRETLSGILLRAAVDAGVEVRERCTVRSLLWDGERVVGVMGAGWQEKGHAVVGADGRGSAIARQTGARTTFDAGALRCTFHAYWRDVAPLPAASLELWHNDGCLVQMGPCDGGLWVVMLSAPVDDFVALRDSDGYHTRLTAIPAMRTRLANAERVSPVYGSGTLRNFHRVPAGPGWWLAGDAYCHKDPLFGAGIADGFAAAAALADKIIGAVAEETTWADAESGYADVLEKKVGSRVRSGIEGLRLESIRPEQRAWVRGVLSHPALALELIERCSELFAGLPPDRRAFWQAVADGSANLLGLPEPARIEPAP